MDLLKIGNFISRKRNELNLTQKDLADKLFVTDRAVSKWECGKSLPSSVIMLKLCEILKVSVNELLIGENLNMENNNKENENKLIETLVKEKENADKRLLQLEIVLGVTGGIFLATMILIAVLGFIYLNLPEWAMYLLICFGVTVFLGLTIIALIIELKVGYYECKNCGHKHIPGFKKLFFAPHINRSRYIKCPNCGKKTYNKKVITKR